MASQHGVHPHLGRPWQHTAKQACAGETASMVSAAGLREGAVALIRVGTGFMFLWAFLDKTFGWGYSTPSAHAWIHGGSPTRGFLASVDAGPFQSWFNAWAGHLWADYLFMIGLAGIGVALILGVGVRLASVCGVLLVAMMWFAVYPPAKYGASGPTGSANPFVDEHVMDAFALLAVGLFGAGSRFGLGAWWAKLPFVARHAALK